MVSLTWRVLLFVTLGLSAAAALPAQRIRGRVLDDSTREPLPGVLVRVVNSRASASTDLTGTFLITLPRPGLAALRLSLAGYATLETDTMRVVEGMSETVLLTLRRTAIPIDTVLVAADARGPGGFYERARQRGGFGQFLTRADIAQRPSSSQVTELLRGVRGVEVVPVRRQRSSFTYNTIIMNGALGPCQPMIVLDGIRMQLTPESAIDDILKPDMLEGVEIYVRSVSAPAWFAAPPTCGVIAFWGRTGSGEGARPWNLKRVLTAAGIGGAMLALLLLGR